MKLCKICNLEKEDDKFKVHSYSNDKVYYRNTCLMCCSTLDKIRYFKTKQDNLEKIILQTAKNRAKKEGLKFDLDISDIIIPEVCPILGIKLSSNLNFAGDNSPSLDRLDPQKGYVKGNCFVISYKANRMKQDNTLDDLEKIISYIIERI